MRLSERAFSLVELLVSIAILTLLVLLVTNLFNSAAAVTASGNKRMDADGQARPLLNRLALDMAQLVKRPDIDYFFKTSANVQAGNDRFAFYSMVPGYSSGTPGSISLIAYRATEQNKLERMAKGLLWNGVSSTSTPMVFLPLTIASTWPTAVDVAADADYELIGPNVFRFEYGYQLTSGQLSVTPWDASAGHSTVKGLQDVASIFVAIAAIDPKSRVLLSDTQIDTLVGRMVDFTASMKPGDLVSAWQTVLNTTTDMPRPALSGIRIYERHFVVSPRP